MDCAVGCFDNVLFPLLDELITVEVRNLDPSGMDETRMRGVGLLCNLFLHHEVRLSGSRELSRLWARILSYITGFMLSGPEFVVRLIINRDIERGDQGKSEEYVACYEHP